VINVPVRAKFKWTAKEAGGSYPSISLHAVVGGDNPENDSFFKATPSGNIGLGVVNEEAASQFEVGKEYYVDFTPAE
jgi:hypothetical protein